MYGTGSLYEGGAGAAPIDGGVRARLGHHMLSNSQFAVHGIQTAAAKHGPKIAGVMDSFQHAHNVIGDLQSPGGWRTLTTFAREGFHGDEKALSPAKRLEIERERAFRGNS